MIKRIAKKPKLKTIGKTKIDSEDLLDAYEYQPELTRKLDRNKSVVTQELINEIGLWKVNRYAVLKNNALTELNKIPTKGKVLDEALTRKVLKLLLETNGIQLPMASTILRFRNPLIYQIIDQRVYRFIAGKDLKSPGKLEDKIELYLKYLELLKGTCKKYGIEFKDADRVLYQADKDRNKKLKIKS